MTKLEELKGLLKRANISQKEFAKMVGLSQPKISLVVSNPNIPKAVENYFRILEGIRQLKAMIAATEKKADEFEHGQSDQSHTPSSAALQK